MATSSGWGAGAQRLRRQGHGTSKVSARVEMVRDVVSFFEKEVPAMFHNVLAVVGSLVMLVYDVNAGLIALSVLLPMGLITALVLAQGGAAQSSDQHSDRARGRRYLSGRASRVRRHFRLLRRWRVKLSDTESWTWAVTELATIVALSYFLLDPQAKEVTASGKRARRGPLNPTARKPA